MTEVVVGTLFWRKNYDGYYWLALGDRYLWWKDRMISPNWEGVTQCPFYQHLGDQPLDPEEWT